MKNTLYLPALLIAAAAFFTSCKPDPDPPPTNTGTDYRKGMWIINEGQFLGGNASITWITYDGATRKTDVFTEINGRPLGDIAQSITVIGSRAYVVVNNSGKIEVLNTSTMASSGTITGFTSPRYIQEVSPGKAYVTDLFGGNISIVDLETKSITGSIPASGWTEQMVVKNNEVFVGLGDTNFVYVINATTNVITDTIPVTEGVSGMTLDGAGNLWVQIPARLVPHRSCHT
jgi:DNA-binding beta-propeller fold protein YncE